MTDFDVEEAPEVASMLKDLRDTSPTIDGVQRRVKVLLPLYGYPAHRAPWSQNVETGKEF